MRELFAYGPITPLEAGITATAAFRLRAVLS